MRLLFEKGFSPTHAFSAFYQWLKLNFNANAVLHFGMHGALEFMPGKQVGLSGQCWPDRLIADLPNVYLYAANNPSEGLIAKRRAASTLISYLTPPVTHSDLYCHLVDLRAAIDHWRQRPADIEQGAEQAMIDTVLALAAQCELCEEGSSGRLINGQREYPRCAINSMRSSRLSFPLDSMLSVSRSIPTIAMRCYWRWRRSGRCVVMSMQLPLSVRLNPLIRTRWKPC